MSRPKRDEKTKDTVELVNRAGNRARVDPGSAGETYFKARGYKLVDDEAEVDDSKAALLRPRGTVTQVTAEVEKPPVFTGARTAAEPEAKPEPQKSKGGKE